MPTHAAELAEAKKVILQHTSDAGSLSELANVIIKFVYRLSPQSYFTPVKGAASEWKLAPKSWVALYLSRGRGGSDPKIIVSIDLWPDNVPSELRRLEIKQGRMPQWSKFTVNDIAKLGDALRLIEFAWPGYSPKTSIPPEIELALI